MKRTAALLCLLLATACGGASPPAAQPSPAAAVPSASPSVTASPRPTVPHFDAPEAAMRYLASAWNRHDLVQLKHVTTASARSALEVMRHEAVDLRLDRCARNDDRRDYDCTFTHGFPAGYQGHRADAGYAQTTKPGTATFVVGPADRSGWYMTVLESCG